MGAALAPQTSPRATRATMSERMMLAVFLFAGQEGSAVVAVVPAAMVAAARRTVVVRDFGGAEAGRSKAAAGGRGQGESEGGGVVWGVDDAGVWGT